MSFVLLGELRVLADGDVDLSFAEDLADGVRFQDAGFTDIEIGHRLEEGFQHHAHFCTRHRGTHTTMGSDTKGEVAIRESL